MIRLIESYAVEIAAGGVIACVAAIAARKLFKVSAKAVLLASFVLGAAITFAIDMLLMRSGASVGVSNAMTAGALAIVLTSFTKKLAFMDKDDIRANLENLLSSIVLSDELDKVVGGIVEKIRSSSEVDENVVKQVLKDNMSVDVDENTLDLVAKFILKALESDKNQ